MRSAAKIDPVALPVERNFLVRNTFDDLDLVVLAHVAKQFDCLSARHFFAHDLQIGLGQFLHALFDLRQLFRRKSLARV